MKKMIFFIIVLVFSLNACGDDPNKGPSAKEVVDKYVNTMKTAPDIARDAVKDVEARQDLDASFLDQIDE
jgi:hypothetical protein